MDDKYLDNLFRDKLEEPQYHAFDESAWNDMAFRLEHQEPTRNRWWLMAASILIPVLITCGFFYNQLRNAQHEIKELQAKINDLQPTLQSQEKIIAVTTENPLNSTQSASNASIPENQPNAYAVISTISTTETTFEKPTIMADIVDEMPAKVEIFSEDKEENSVEKLMDEYEYTKDASTPTPVARSCKVESTDFLSAHPFKNLVPTPEVAINEYNLKTPKQNFEGNKKKFFEPVVNYLKPEGYSTGLRVTGASFLSNLKGVAYAYGINGEIDFRESMSAGLGIEHMHINHRVEQNDVHFDVPTPGPQHPDDQLQAIDLALDMIQIPLYFKYNIEEERWKLNPFVKVGGIAKKVIQRRYDMEFLSAETQKSYTKNTLNNPPNTNFSLNTISASVGIEREVGKNINWQLEAFLNYSIDSQPNDGNYNLVGLNTQVSYMF